jgi:hypothetical protein
MLRERAMNWSTLALAAALGCASAPAPQPSTSSVKQAPRSTIDAQPAAATPPPASVLVAALVEQHGEPQRARIERGVRQVLALWRPQDGDARAFVLEAFADDPAPLLERFSKALEQVDGHFLEIGRALQSWSQLELGPQLPIDDRFAALDLSAHLSDDLFESKLAFVALLNFPMPELQEMLKDGPSWSRRQWAAARLTRRFAQRPSGAALQARAAASAAAESYIAGYNLWMHHVLFEGKRIFPPGVRLLTHWNLRDEIKADYAEKDRALGLARQRAILAVMNRIVTQTIPKAVIDDPRLDWDPVANTVTASPAAEIETQRMNSQGKRPRLVSVSTEREPDTRYAILLADYQAARKADADSPLAPSEMARHFDFEDELPRERVRALLTQVLTSPLVPKVAAIIQKRLGRPLEPQDIWYNGFLESRTKQPEEELSKLTRARYPTAEAYKKDIPRLLKGLGFSAEKARFLDQHIVVDPARGSGHALEAARRSEMYPWWGTGDSPHLRTRINPDGMDYKGYNIAIHEMGHNVEQAFSLYEVDDTLLQGVPGTAFTEALAFTFQNRDLELLGLSKPDARSERLRVLNDFWATWEIAGVGLVDLDVWEWMYAHPAATPAELREATLQIARGYWDKYYAPVLGAPGNAQLAIYSHMINSFLYLFRYPIGHLIAFQLEEKLKGPESGATFERMTSFGRVTPDLWMQHATGRPVVAEPLLDAVAAAVGGTTE